MFIHWGTSSSALDGGQNKSSTTNELLLPALSTPPSQKAGTQLDEYGGSSSAAAKRGAGRVRTDSSESPRPQRKTRSIGQSNELQPAEAWGQTASKASATQPVSHHDGAHFNLGHLRPGESLLVTRGVSSSLPTLVPLPRPGNGQPMSPSPYGSTGHGGPLHGSPGNTGIHGTSMRSPYAGALSPPHEVTQLRRKNRDLKNELGRECWHRGLAVPSVYPLPPPYPWPALR